MSRSRRQRGFTILETAISVAIFGLLGTSFVRSFSTATSLTAESRAEAKAQEELRRSLDALANGLRGVAYSSLTGFDVNGRATALSCQPVAGASAVGKTLGSVQQIGWRSTPATVHGVSGPGEITLTQDGVTRVVASRVPAGGLVVTLGANSLTVNLTTYWTTREGKTAVANGQTSVALRN